ncbi:TPA: TerD family protein [Providencia stuartii]|uniref:TerD family protein n=1 Tax=Providencia stuartii TaxID=588 RepID=A0AAJ1JGY3_PROST|nr:MULTISPECIES: TerD family protein [Providencia]EMA3640690.1 TerD family protein [Providencia stuartii]MBN5560659.1 TerD family protein [Providencia stuartii]MBN5600553.1 TerD family protein [Providencia stuartii]MBN5604425.1 TerD family protein [Providencia stuartii]MBW3099493.1 TerD family protein [Providencia stuartii]
MNMTPGANATVPSQTLTIRIQSGMAVDASAFRLYDTGKVKNDADMVFYGQTTNDDQTISFRPEGNNSLFTVDLNRLHPSVQKVAFTATCDGNQTIAGLQRLAIQVDANNEVLLNGTVETNGRQEAALILGELYRRNDSWKFRFIAQGFNGGLKPLAEHFGVDVEDTPTPAPTATPAPVSTPTPPPAPASVNLSKVSLTKEKPSISLVKKDDFGKIRINLDWHRGSNTGSTGFLGGLFGGGNKGIDLDLGAFVELQNREKGVIQALGNTFGFFNSPPFVELQGDDRTGDVSGGEWIYINGREWKNIKQILIYAFIYEGVPSWDKTDGVVTIHVPDQPPIETRLTEGNNGRGMCAIARLVNEQGAIKVERINQFFKGHKDMDNAFGWGFRWTAGSK